MGMSNVRAYGAYGAGPNPTIDTRLDALEKNVTALRECITKEAEEQFRKIDDIVKREQQSRRENDAAIQKKLEAKVTEDTRLAVIGAVWISFGTILSTIPEKIANLIAWFPSLRM
jgi:hypothetical protein